MFCHVQCGFTHISCVPLGKKRLVQDHTGPNGQEKTRTPMSKQRKEKKEGQNGNWDNCAPAITFTFIGQDELRTFFVKKGTVFTEGTVTANQSAFGVK